jgi:hypothetical protein
MSEKVKLPKDVCDALDLVQRIFDISPASIVMDVLQKEHDYDERVKILNEQDANVIMRALVLGYEPELSAEEQIKHLYSDAPSIKGYYEIVYYQKGIRDALKIHGIHYDWMDGSE